MQGYISGAQALQANARAVQDEYNRQRAMYGDMGSNEYVSRALNARQTIAGSGRGERAGRI